MATGQGLNSAPVAFSRGVIMTQKRAIILTRVSSKKQDTRMQLPDCRAYCLDHGFTVVAEIEDKITGVTAVSERPGGKQALELLRKKAADAVVLWTIDRVARDEATIEYLIFKKAVKDLGAELHFTDIGKTSDDPNGAITEFSMAAGAAAERLKFIRRSKAGRHRKITEDKELVLTGQIAFGFRKQGEGRGATLEIDPVESALVRDMFRWYVDRVPTNEILSRVASSGVKTKAGGQWSASGIDSMLRYGGYRGVFSYGKDTLIKPELAIIDPVTWETVQSLLTENRWQKTSNPGQYLLSGGRVQCFCGGGMTGSSAYAICGGERKKYVYYKCTRGHNLDKNVSKRCGRLIRSDKLDKLAWGWLVLLSMNPDHIDQLFDEARKNIERDTKPIQERIDSLIGGLKDIQAEIERLVKRVAKIRDDRVSAPFEKEIERLTDSKTGIETQIEKSQAELAKFGAIPNGRTDRKAMQRELNRLVGAKTFEEKRASIQYFDLHAQIVKKPDGQIKIRIGCFLSSMDDGAEEYDLEGEGGYPAYVGAIEFLDDDHVTPEGRREYLIKDNRWL